MNTCETCKHFSKVQGANVCVATGIVVLVQVQRSERLGSCGDSGKKWEPRND